MRAVLNSWGPGKFDAELFLDGKAFRPDGTSAATLIPPAFGLAGVNLHTWTGWGSITYWNAFVANLEMHGKGNFTDARLDDANEFPVAAANNLGHVQNADGPHHAEARRAAVLPARDPRPGAAGEQLRCGGRRARQARVRRQGECARCHTPPLFTEPGWNMHTARRDRHRRLPGGSLARRPLSHRAAQGLWTHTKGGFYHDGRFATLARRRRPLRHDVHARPHRWREGRPRASI